MANNSERTGDSEDKENARRFYERAIQAGRKAVELSEADSQDRELRQFHLARICSEAGHRKEAADLYSDILNRGPRLLSKLWTGDLELKNRFGVDSKKYQAGAEALLGATSNDEHELPMLQQLASCHLRTGNHEMAIKTIWKSLGRSSDTGVEATNLALTAQCHFSPGQ